MTAEIPCSECGAPIPAGSPGGFCSPCLLALGLGPPAETEEAALALPGPTVRPSFEQAGDRIGRYRLLREIGHGGCGLVYLAEQEEPVRRRVALKVIKLGMDTRQVVARFEAERQALALMDHAHIARVLDAGATETGRPYFVMEFVGGVKITEYCDRNQLAIRERLDLFIHVCRAVQHAHQKGIIHRDIKPSNILVAVQDGKPVPKIIDFGIAKATQGRLTDQTLFTAVQQFLGTPAYMSPEQTQFGSLDVDTRSDIYSLGVLLYELLTGRTPFDTKELVAADLDGMRRDIREKEPDRPSTRLKNLAHAELHAVARRRRSDPPGLLRLLRGDLDWIVMKCLEKDRARRYETANGLAMDIERHLNDEPIVARPLSKWYEFRKTVRRHAFGFAATAAIMVILAVAAALSAWQALRTQKAVEEQSRLRQEAQAARQDATERLRDSYLAEARALRLTGQSGRRFESLDALRKAAAIRPSPALRNEVIKCLALADLRSTGSKDFSRPRRMVTADPSSDRYAVGDGDGAVSIRRIGDDAELGRLPGLKPRLLGGLRLSRDGRFVLAYYEDARYRVWDWGKGTVTVDWPAPPRAGADFSADGHRVVISDSKHLWWFDSDRGVTLYPVSLRGLASEQAPGWVRLDPTGQRAAVFRLDSETNVVILDPGVSGVQRTLAHSSFVYEPAWHPDGRHLAVGCADGTIHLWDTMDGRHLGSWATVSSVSIGFNHRGDLLASSGWDNQTRLWRYPGGRPLVSIRKSGHVLGFSPDDGRLTLLHWDSTGLDLLETVSDLGLRTLYDCWDRKTHGGGQAVFGLQDRLIASETPAGIAVWDARSGRALAALDGQGETLALIGFHGTGADLVFSSRQGLQRWSMPDASGALSPTKLVNSACADPEGARLGRLSADGTLCGVVGAGRCQIFRTDTFAIQAETGVQPGMRFIALSPDGSWIATGAWQYGGVKVWNARNGELVRALPGDEERLDSSTLVEFSPDGQLLVTSTLDEYRFWSTANWSLLRRTAQEPGNDFPGPMAFSHDGKLFAGVHSRHVVRLWDAVSGSVLADFEAPDGDEVSALSFSQDDTQLALCESRSTLRVWDLPHIRARLASMNLDWDTTP